MPRFRRRIIRRGRRPRTRWLAITPGAITGIVTNTYQASQLTPQDITGVLNWSQFTGGTILRVLLDMTIDPTWTAQPPPWDAAVETHVGLFVVSDTGPDASTWDPNIPHGNFMMRQHASERVRVNDPSDGGGVIRSASPNARMMVFDTEVKRRINEGSKLWFSTKSFLVGSAIIANNIGWTGRVLVQLP